MKSKKWLLAALIPFLLLGWQQGMRAQEWPFLGPALENPFAPLQTEQPALNLTEPLVSEVYQQYLRFYGLDFADTQHYAGYVSSSGEQIFVQVFKPQKASRGTVVTMHGYFVHTGLIVHLIQALLEQNYTVVSIDLPGHGLSSGARASIHEFGRYAQTLADVTEQITALPKPFLLFGHSTGGAGVWEYLLQHPDHPYRQAVLAAPLVRSAYWELSLLGFYLGQGWLAEVPRVLKPTSSDPTFSAMVRRDPLQYAGTPVQWVRALIEWNDKVIENYPPSNTPLLIIQGTEDTVVEWHYNLPFLERKFRQSSIRYLPGAMHDLLWEAPELRKQVFEATLSFFDSIKGILS